MRYLSVALIVVLITSCSTTKYVLDGNHLLSSSAIIIDNNKIKKDDLKPLLKQKPNKSFLWIYKFHLQVYDLSNPNKNNGWNNYLRKIGEEPVIYDSLQTKITVGQFKNYLANKGYYHAVVSDSVKFRRKKAFLKYFIKTGAPIKIESVDYNFEDSLLTYLVLNDTINSMVRPGTLFDIDILQKERQRIENSLRSKGYYYFSKDYIYYDADTTVAPNLVDLTLGIKMFLHKNPDNTFDTVPHRKYIINNINIYPQFDPRKSLLTNDSLINQDTISTSDLNIIYDHYLDFKPKALIRPDYIYKGDIYNSLNVEQTYKHYSSLGVFKMVNLQFEDVKDSMDTAGNYLLNCKVLLTPSPLMNYKIEPEVSNSGGFPGFAINLNYQHKNLFKGAENMDVGLRSAVEWMQFGGKPATSVEIGPHLNLRIPKFLLPIKKESFVKRYDPITNLTLGFDYQKNPYFTKITANTSFGYVWKGSMVETNYLNLIDFNYVKIDKSQQFADSINKKHLENVFNDHLVSSITYSYLFNNQAVNKRKDYIYFRMNLQPAGILPPIANITMIYNNPLSQFLRGDFDFHYNRNIDERSSLAYRAFFGIAVPYGNSSFIPYDWRYFSSGVNGMRAWKPKTLGPGSYPEFKLIGGYYTVTGDIKIETNFEYRFKLFWLLEGAWFIDIGNVWDLKKDDTRPGGNFVWDNFYTKFAIGSGLGFRFNFPFVLARIDIGAKLRDPAGSDSKWIIGNGHYNIYDNCVLNLGIGYPF